MTGKKLVAVDIGAGSGRFFVGTFDGSGLTVSEESRFYHTPITVGTDVYWNFLQIWDSVCNGMRQVSGKHGAITSIGFDSFAPDFGLFDPRGQLLSNPLSYRTVLGSHILERILERMDARELYGYSGLQCAEILLLPQLFYLMETGRTWMLARGTLLPLASGLNHLLTGRRSMDFTVASISMLWDGRENRFSHTLIDRFLSISGFLPEVAENQSVLSGIQPSLAIDGYRNTRVVNSGIHDTAVATYALNLAARGQICMNCGTWTAISVVVDRPLTDETAFRCGLTNYGLPDGRYMLGRVVLGLFYLQKCREEWARQGKPLGYAELSAMARDADSFLVDFKDPLFQSTEESVQDRIVRYFVERQQKPPRTIGEFTRCILESLAARYAEIIRSIEAATGVVYSEIHMGGGGIREPIVRRRLQTETKKDVRCVATEVTAIGNLISQLIAQREIRGDEAERLLSEVTRNMELDEN